MKVFVTGTRGIPNIIGGVETHCEELFPLVARREYKITLARRSAYVMPDNVLSIFNGVYLVDIFSPKTKSFEAIIHSFLAIVYAKRKHFDVIHIHAIGPSLVIPIARFLGLKVIMTHHGPDYDRQKWGLLAKASLKLGEWCAAKFANEIIVISETINQILKTKYNRHNAWLIPNGVKLPVLALSDEYIKSLGLLKGQYIIAVGRFVPEKGFHDLIDAYLRCKLTQKLVLVGEADHESEYSQSLKDKARKNNVVLTGFIKGDKLNEIFTHAALFVMPSYHEGLPIALLEAMSYNLKVLVSDIPANLEVKLRKQSYFNVGDVDDLAFCLTERLNSSEESNYTDLIRTKYNWETIAKMTIQVYNKLR